MEKLLEPAALTALWFGLLSAVSLPIGAWVGIFTKPTQKITAGVMAYGAGALLAALTLELVNEALEHAGFWPLASGCVGGAITFVVLNQALNNKGGFLRKASTLKKFVRESKRKRVAHILTHLSEVGILNALPPEEMAALVPHVDERTFEAGTKIVLEGEPGFELYIVDEGQLEVTQDGKRVAELGPKDVFGEMALLAHETRQATVVAKTKVTIFEIHKQDFDHIIQSSPELRDEFNKMYETRKQNLTQFKLSVDSKEWAAEALGSADRSVFDPTVTDVNRAVAEEHAKGGGSPMSIWLGILLDGIPESAVIGASMVGGAKVSLALIVGLFLANFPESMASAVGMKKMGMSSKKISWLWISLCIMTGVGAWIGNVTFQSASPQMHALFEGLAAGAMLAAIAETMLPEAFEQGGSITGMSTVLGFLSAIFVKSLEH